MELRLADIGDREFHAVHGAALRLLGDHGMLFEHDEARELLRSAGAVVEPGGRVRIGARMVEAALAAVPADGFTLYGRDGSRTCRVAVDEIAFRPSIGEPFVWDWNRRERRPAASDDVRVMVTVTDALGEFAVVNPVVNPADMPGSEANVRGFVASHRWSLKPSELMVSTAREVAAVAAVASAIRGPGLRERPLASLGVAVTSPLRCSRDETDALLASARAGLPVGILSAPLMAVSAPASLAGSVAVCLAEILAVLCLLYRVAPGLPVIALPRVSPVNLRTGACAYGAPELGMASALCCACCARYRLPTNLYGLASAALAPGAQAVLEKVMGGLLLALGRAHMVSGPGVLDSALATSPEQLVVDNEIARFIRRVRQPIAIDERSLAVDATLRVLRGGGTFLAEEQTLELLRSGELLDASLGQWMPLEEWERRGRPDLLDLAHERVVEILASHRVPGFEPGLERRIEQIIAHAFR
jgi:trimethylamine--corrinoid protein Co-methyltransferase